MLKASMLNASKILFTLNVTKKKITADEKKD